MKEKIEILLCMMFETDEEIPSFFNKYERNFLSSLGKKKSNYKKLSSRQLDFVDALHNRLTYFGYIPYPKSYAENQRITWQGQYDAALEPE